MEEKMFELMEKLYSEIQGLKSDMKLGFTNVDKRFEKVEQNQVRMEQSLESKVAALFDGYKLNTEKISLMNDKLDKIEDVIINKSIIIPKEYFVQLKKAE